jgi:hypothetical protein
MSISLGNAASLGGYPLNNMDVSHVLQSGSNRMVVAFFALHGATSYTISTATYNSTNMTQLGFGICPALYSRSIAIYCYYILEASLPAAGTYTCRFKSNAGYAGGVAVYSMSNVAQSAPNTLATAGNSRNPDLTGRYTLADGTKTFGWTPGGSYSHYEQVATYISEVSGGDGDILYLDSTATEINSTNTPDTQTPAQTDTYGTINMTGSTYQWGSRILVAGTGAVVDNAAIMGATF